MNVSFAGAECTVATGVMEAVVLAQFVVQKKLIHSNGRRSRSDKSKVKTTLPVDLGSNMFIYLLLRFNLKL